ncbi:fungal-specific transcription factor domain-containing protein [Lipomyces tetrasporus]|uniref:Fungal-specific transcription factor domain-containing protein n=1 Tax=Lipomyces tetrasporus TaxID=54092 RepID=A0AAD7R037_9ASCO|nr:fungal-specific transcription factor domain-containing protein [Lipomyces tetrasporus]KAJ8104061.1 fungal-specific transcription factor domain-containing protein [Lipomyces tetrasporus]
MPVSGNPQSIPCSPSAAGQQHRHELLPTSSGEHAHDSNDDSAKHGSNEHHHKLGHSSHHGGPGGDKRKLVIACIACRKKKVKCSGDRPACGNCLRLNVPCQYPAVKNRGSRFGYHEMLNKRLEMMERHIKPPAVGNISSPYHASKLSASPSLPREHSDSNSSTSTNVITPAANSSNAFDLSTNSASAKQRLKRAADGTFKGLGSGVDPATADDDVDSDLIHSLGDTVGSGDADSPTRDRVQVNSVLANVNMPDFEIIHHLTELYFRYLNNQSYSFLHKPTFIPRLRAGQVNPLLVLAVCAVSARFSRHPQIMTQPRYSAGEPFLQEARKLLSQEFDEPTVETTQAILIMGFNDFCGLNGGRAAIYSGLSMRMAATLGLNKESDDQNLSWVDREIRRKTWWSVLVFDRLAHSGPKRSFLLMEEECQIQLPSSDHAFLNNIPVVTELLTGEYPPNDPELPRVSLDLPGYHVKSVIMWGHITSYVNMDRKKENFAPWTEYSEFHKLEREIDSFYSSLPPHLVYSRDNLIALDATQQAGTFVHMHVCIQQSLCALHRCIYPYDHSNSKFEAPPISFIERSANKLTAAACAISGILNDTLQVEDVLPAAFVGFGAYNSATVHIVNAFSTDSAISMMAKKHLTVNLKFLVLLREYWAIAGGWCTTLKDRYFHKLQLEADVVDRTSAISRPPSPTVRYGTLDYAGPGASPSAAKSESSGTSPRGSNGRRSIPSSQPPPPTSQSLMAPTPVLAVMTDISQTAPQQMLPPLPRQPRQQQQQQQQAFTETLVLPPTFPPIEDEQPNPYQFEFDEAWLRALENNKDQVVIDTDRVGENSFLDFGSSNWFIDMPAQTIPQAALVGDVAQIVQMHPQQHHQQHLPPQQPMMVQQERNEGNANGMQSASDSFFNEIFGDIVWDLNSAAAGNGNNVNSIGNKK